MTPSIALEHNVAGPVPETEQTPAGHARTSDLFSLGGRTTVVTGGGRGVGIVLAGAVLEAGGDVVCLDLLPTPSEIEWKGVQKLAASKGLQAIYTQCDITDEEATKTILEKMAAEGMQRNMPLRGLVTCAGIQQMTPALEYPIDGFRRMMEVKYVQPQCLVYFSDADDSSVIGTFIPAKHCARIFKEQGTPGSMVMIASMSGDIANRVRTV